MNQVAKRHDHASLLQSLVEPSAKIAKGFESVTIVLQSGQLVAGVIRSEENGMIIIEQPDGKLVTISADDVEDRTAPKSAMPEMHRALTLRVRSSLLLRPRAGSVGGGLGRQLCREPARASSWRAGAAPPNAPPPFPKHTVYAL